MNLDPWADLARRRDEERRQEAAQERRLRRARAGSRSPKRRWRPVPTHARIGGCLGWIISVAGALMAVAVVLAMEETRWRCEAC